MMMMMMMMMMVVITLMMTMILVEDDVDDNVGHTHLACSCRAIRWRLERDPGRREGK